MFERQAISKRVTRRALLKASLLSAAALWSGTAVHATSDSKAQQWLAATDDVRNPSGAFSVKVVLSEYRQSKLAATSQMVVFAKPSDNTGQFNNLIRLETPSRDEGKLILRNGLDIWFYDPASHASVRISPQQRLLGQASNNDVMSTNLAKDFEATLQGIENITGGDSKPVRCVHLQLQAQRADVAYPFADYWIEESTQRPVKAQFYTAERRLLKTAYFRRYQSELGKDRPTETVIIDGLDPSWVTVMRLSEYKTRDVPSSWLQREYLPRFTEQP